MEEIFEHDGNFYIIEPLKYEPREFHMERVEYIFRNINKKNNVKSFEKLKRLSIIWSNVKNYQCEYNQSIMDQIDQ